MNIVKRLNFIFNKKQKIQFVGLFFLILIGAAFELLGVSLILPFVQALTSPEKFLQNKYAAAIYELFNMQTINQFLVLITAGLIGVYVVKNVFLVFSTYIQYQILYHNQIKMSTEIMRKYMNMPYLFHLDNNSAKLQRTILSDVNQTFVVVQQVLQLISDVVTSALLIILLINTDITITLGVLMLLIVFVLVYFKIFKKRLIAYGKMLQIHAAKVIQCINTAFGGIKEIKIFKREEYFVEQYRHNVTMQSSMIKRANFAQILPKYLIEATAIGGILGIVLIKLVSGSSMETLIPQLAVFAIAAFRLLPSVNRMNAEVSSILNYRSSVNLIYDLMKDKDTMEEEILEVQKNPQSIEKIFPQSIFINNLSFHYPNHEKLILDDVSMEIPIGVSVAFVGPSGAGKTTLADILLGILPPTQGKIEYLGMNIHENRKEWSSKLGYIPQNIFLSDDSIKNNVAFGLNNNDIDLSKLDKALDMAQIKEFVYQLPEGVETMIGERGVRLSGGQRQRLGIARALYNNPEILVLDEATSALDTETETAVMEAIDFLKGKKTLIIIAHRLTTIKNCDKIYHVENGAVTENSNIVL